MSDASAIKGEDAFIVGGANSAGQAAIYFSDFARSVTMLVRGNGLSDSMSQYLVDQIGRTPNIEVQAHTTVAEAIGGDHVEGLPLRDAVTGECRNAPASALFVFIGELPRTEWLGGAIARDERGFILTGTELELSDKASTWPLERDPFLLETSIPRGGAAGDVRHDSGKRVATAVGEGAMAVMTAWPCRATNGL